MSSVSSMTTINRRCLAQRNNLSASCIQMICARIEFAFPNEQSFENVLIRQNDCHMSRSKVVDYFESIWRHMLWHYD